jgi:hypothetical protein
MSKPIYRIRLNYLPDRSWLSRWYWKTTHGLRGLEEGFARSRDSALRRAEKSIDRDRNRAKHQETIEMGP